jgi:hypothetical protein
MSETQNEQETDAEPTPGPWRIPEPNPYAVTTQFDEGGSHKSICSMIHGLHGVDSDDEKEANARFIAAAGTAAQEARGMGYDPQKTVEAVPELLSLAQQLRATLNALDRNFRGTFAGEEQAVENFLDALASAEGSEE